MEVHLNSGNFCQCCKKRVIVTNPTTTARTMALEKRLARINKRRKPLEKKDTELIEKSRLLRIKAQMLLQEPCIDTPNKSFHTARRQYLQHRLKYMKRRVTSLRRKDAELHSRGRELTLQAQNLINSPQTSFIDESPSSDTFQRNSVCRKVFRSRNKKSFIPSVLLDSPLDLRTFVKDGLQCTKC